MEQIQIKKEIIEFRWKAIDGTEFSDRDECIKYEKTVECAVTAQYKKRVVYNTDEQDMFNVGSCDEIIDVYYVKCEEDKKVAVELYKLINEADQHYADEFYNKLSFGFNLFARGYDNDCLWFVGSENSIIEKIKNHFEKFKELGEKQNKNEK